MKLKHFLILIALLTVVGAIYAIHSQITPKPLRSFLVTEVMSSPQKDNPYLSTWTSARDGYAFAQFVKMALG